MNSSNKIIFNTGVLYSQLIIQMLLGLFTTRMVLKALGETDYGIYMLVAGVVSMLGVLNTSMINTSMRYIAHSLGTKNELLLKKTFCTTLFINIIVGFFIIIFMELGGWIFFEYILNIPSDKMFAAKVVYQFMIITTLVSIISVPYDAVMNAHEDILILSIIDIFGFLLNFILAIYLLYVSDNLLILYGLFLFVNQLMLRVIKQIISRRRYKECRDISKKHISKQLIRDILSFTGWNLFSMVAVLFAGQLRGVFLNLFFGVRLNTAEGLGKQVNAAINKLSTGITRAITPQMTKNEGAGNRDNMIRITNIGIKYTTIMFALVAVPFVMECSYFLKLWLGNVPDYAVVFCQLIIISQMLEKFTWQIGNAICATGIVKKYQRTEGCVLLLTIPIGFLMLYTGHSPISIFIVEIVAVLCVAVVRVYYGKIIVGINIPSFIKDTILPILFPLLISTVLALGTQYWYRYSVHRVFFVFSVYVVSLLILFYYIGMSKYEKNFLKDRFIIVLKKMNKK